MGYHDSLNAIKKSVAAGKVEITIDGVDVVFSGDTFRHKDFLIEEISGNNDIFCGM